MVIPLDERIRQVIVRAHTWLKLQTDGTHHSIESLARAVDLHPKVISNRIQLQPTRASRPSECRLRVTAFLASFGIELFHKTAKCSGI